MAKLPTGLTVADQFGFRSTHTSACHLAALKRKGCIESAPGKARALRVISPLTKLCNRIAEIPLVGAIAAGSPGDVEEEPEGCVTVDIKSIGFTPNRNTIAMRVKGDSMIGRQILDGDFVIVERGADGRDGQIVVAQIDGQRTLNTLIIKGDKPFLKAENPKFPALIPKQELVFEGVMKGLIPLLSQGLLKGC